MSQPTSTQGPLALLHETAGRNAASRALLEAAEGYLHARASVAISATGRRVEDLADRLSDPTPQGVARGSSKRAGPGAAQRGQRGEVREADQADDSGDSGDSSGSGGSGGGGQGKGGATTGSKFNNIIEDRNIGVPLRQVYNQWTLYSEFSDMMRGVTGVDAQDEVTTSWKVKVAKSNRTWTATVTEQIPDERIAWVTEGSKGSTRGVVTFHALGENLTKVLVVIEYFPSGFFEKTANMWWAASRRARLDIKHFCRHISMNGAASDEGWRGEIRDGEVIRSHDEAIAAEQAQTDEAATDQDEASQDEASQDEEDGRAETEPEEDSEQDSEQDQDRDQGDDEPETEESESEEAEGDEPDSERERLPRQRKRSSSSPRRPRRPQTARG